MRILIIDDEAAMHDSYARSFSAAPGARAGLEAMASELFGRDAAGLDAEAACARFELTHALQGLEGVAAVERALAAEAPFAVAFIDVRMPPGIDGKETARRIRALDPDINLVIVTGYSDHAPLDISRAAGPADKIFYIAKPFEVAEVVQTASALCHRWHADRELAAAREAMAAQVRLLEEQKLELAASESRAVHMANHDALTEAPNRLAFLRALQTSVRSGEMFATAMLDLDRFKLVNDSYGHLAGDELIRAVFARLHEAAPAQSLVARLGGDEFAVLFTATGEDDAAMTCERLVKACARTFTLFGNDVQGGASVGVVVVEPGAAGDPVDVMRRADLALNEAKRQGRGLVRVFTEAMDESIRLRRRIEDGLSHAITAGELKLHYQPIVARESLEITGFEALLRWQSPEYGTMSPALFIPIAEESNLIHDLGDWVLEAALETVKTWPGQYVSVNFSPRQFRRQNFVGQLVERVQRSGVAPNRVQIEITETAIFDDAERAADTLYRLRQMGFRIALDDFGTGYSSLTNIRKFALDCLKVDRSFIDGMGRERTSMAIVQSIVHLGRSLGLEVVAEGVETEAQVDTLRAAGCSHLQGYHLARPMPAEDALLLAERRFVRAPITEAPGTAA
ncbi:diguanylate cyclase (GGDEF) domain-containing protein [Sphingomonas guangdongensis]|uniref:Diguanylate cyclase (GGDEF) domain-containing protein n=1 Tax=Sphingomonas guangdongensis TaxID=1141890 RepID=A0A285QZC8_9SPHN|nr:EAL domain-containing protein [Sphingomonas guangdongensis]SOB86858.1 diguanylate cyclase (GGDEF) domain-containing protein [Sphingomonas guangdongensis]